MRFGVSLVLSALFAQVVCAEVCPSGSSDSSNGNGLTINAGQTCTISGNRDVDSYIKNSGTLELTGSANITFQKQEPAGSAITITTESTPPSRGKINVRTSAIIDASTQNGLITITSESTSQPQPQQPQPQPPTSKLTIEGQDITIDQNSSLTLKAEEITLGGNNTAQNAQAETISKMVTITGHNSITNSTSNKNVILDSTTSLTTKDLSLVYTRISGTKLETLTNTKLTLKNSYITSDSPLTIKSDASSSTFIVLKGSTSTISAKDTLTIANTSEKKEERVGASATNGATHTFKGEGVLDFQANTITLGETGKATTLKQEAGSNDQEGQGQTTVGFIADTKLLATNLVADGIKMQVIKNSGATLSNVDSTFKGAILQAIDRDNKDQSLTIENGNTPSTTTKPKTAIKAGKIQVEGKTTFLGSGLQIYGQEITIKSSTSTPPTSTAENSTLILQTLKDEGEIILGKKNTPVKVSKELSEEPSTPAEAQENQDGAVKISGNSTNVLNADSAQQAPANTLQLRANQTSINGKVTLNDLAIQTQSKNTGMVFAQGADGELVLDNVSITAGIKDDKNQGNYQSLSFSSEGRGKLIIDNQQVKAKRGVSTGATTTTSTLKASEFAFYNQDISLATKATGATLNLYAYGKTALSSSGEGMGQFYFDNTTITDGSSSTINLYTKEGARLTAHHLTLEGVTIQTYGINTPKADTKNPIDLSSTDNDITIKKSVKIDTGKFLYGQAQGIGANLTIIGGTSNDGSLELTSATEGEKFIFGGTLTLDNSSATTASSAPLKITLGANKNDSSEYKVALEFYGGLTVIGKANGAKVVEESKTPTTTTLTAKSFVFAEGSSVSSINGKLVFDAKETNSTGIDISKAKTILKGLESSEATIATTENGTLKLGDVDATGKTKIENAIFVNSNLKVRSFGANANTLTISNNSKEKAEQELTGIQSINLEDSNLVINGGLKTLKLNNDATVTSRGVSKIQVENITSDSTYSINVQSGTLTLQTGTASATLQTTSETKLHSLTLGTLGKQGAHLVMLKSNSTGGAGAAGRAVAGGAGGAETDTHTTFSAQKVDSYKDSSITAKSFSFDNIGVSGINATSEKGVQISSTGGELKFIATNGTSPQSPTDPLTIKSGTLKLDSGSFGYYTKTNGATTLAKLTLHNSNTSVAIDSKGDSSIQASELELKGNTISSVGGFLTLKGLKSDSTFGNITLGDHGGLMIDNTDTANSTTRLQSSKTISETIKVTDKSTLTLQANAPFTSSADPLGGGRFGTLHSKTLEFEGTGGVGNPLVKIEILQKPIIGEELFKLQEGKQIVVETEEGIFKKVNSTQQPLVGQQSNEKQNLTLEDIFIAPTGYKSLTLTAQLLDDKKQEVTTGNKANIIQVTLSASQGTALEHAESIQDPLTQKQMQDLIQSKRNEEMLDNILSSSNSLKLGFTELIRRGDIITVRDALSHLDDAYTSLANSIIYNERIQTQLAQIQATNIANRLARGKNPYKGQEELARFIRSYHNTAYASSDEDLLSEQSSPTHKGEFWASYDGSMATGNGANSLVNGIMVGYDYDLSENILLGGLVQYGYASFDGNYLHTTSNNIALALYSRMYFGGNELDMSASQNFGFNRATIQVGTSVMPQQINGAMDYDLFRTTASFIYGYRFGVGEEESPYYLKPLIGIEMSYLYQEGGINDAFSPLSSSAMSAFKTTLSIGMEVRKYFTANNYIFFTPAVLRDLYYGGSDAEVGLVDVKKMTYSPSYTSQTSLGLQAGGEGQVGENLSVNGSLGFRLGVEKTELLTNWSVGLKYKF